MFFADGQLPDHNQSHRIGGLVWSVAAATQLNPYKGDVLTY